MIRNVIKSIPFLYKFLSSFLNWGRIVWSDLHPIQGKGNVITCNGVMRKCHNTIYGDNNLVVIGYNSVLTNDVIRIRGCGNRLIIENQVHIGGGSSFWLEGNNNTIIVHSRTSFNNTIHVNAQEHDTVIEIGEDCMLSNKIIIRTSDSHPIYDMNGKRINEAKSVHIGKHVWIAPSSTIMKGVSIGDNSIIGSNTLVTRDIPSDCLAVGMPAKVVKENVRWTHENVIL